MIGIIILNYNSYDDTIKCISSIEKHTTVLYNIYIVDGCSQDNSYEYLLNYYRGNEKIKILKSILNGGYSFGNNFGARRAIKEGADSILIINPDIILKNNAIDIMYMALLACQELAVVGPRILNTKEEDMQFASRLYDFKAFLCSRKPLAYFKNKHIIENRYYNYNYKNDFTFQGMVSGCCFMIRTEDLKSIGFLDDNIFLFYEEDIIAYKLFQINKLTKIVSGSLVIHNHSKTVRKEGQAFIRYHRFYSSQYVLREYAGINDLQFIIVSLFHILPFSFYSIFFRAYRKLYFPLLGKILLLKQNG